MKIKKILSYLAYTLCIFSVSVPVTYAKSQYEAFAEKTGYNTNPNTNFASIAGSVINVLLSLMGIVFTLLILYGGYNWMMASGDEGRVTTAKNIIKNASIGLAIVMAAYAISNFVLDALIKTT